MHSILKWTLWQRRWSIVWWCVGVISLVVITMVFYPTIHNQADSLNKSFGGLSNNTLALFGGTDFFSPVGYLNSQLVYLMFPLLLTILGVGLGSSLIGRDETDGTIESLLSRPISRTKLLSSKALAGALIVFIVASIGSAFIIAMARVVHLGIPLGNIVLVCTACYLLVLTFSAVAFLLAATGRGRAAALGIAGAYTIGGYIFGSLASTIHWLKTPSLIFPYHYYRSADILRGDFNWSSIWFFTIFIIGCLLLSWLSFRRRDLG